MQGASDNTDNKPKVTTNAIVVIIATCTGYSMSRWEKNKCDGAEGNWKLVGANKDRVHLWRTRRNYIGDLKRWIWKYFMWELYVMRHLREFNITNIT